MEDLMHMDLYGLLEICQTSSTKEIKTAYRKKALSCHPDKHPDNPKAAELFHQLSKVLEILTDESARAAYDKVIQAKAQAKIRSEQLDAKRKKFKDDLEAREKLISTGPAKSDEQKLKEEIERLQKAGSKLVEEEVAFVNQQINQQMQAHCASPARPEDSARVKIKWKAGPDAGDNSAYDHDILKRIFSKYGDVLGVVISGNKKGRGMVEFKERSAAEMAVMIERGLMGNPLVLQGLWDNQRCDHKHRTTSARIFPSSTESLGKTINTFPSFPSAPDVFASRRDDDFENLVLGNLRRAEERKKLIQQIAEEEGE